MLIEDLAKNQEDALPDSRLVKYFRASIPHYKIEATLKILKEKEISQLQEYILKFISNGIEDISEITAFLGIRKATVNNAIALMYKDDFISINMSNSKVKITEKGKDVLLNAKAIVPEEIDYPFYVDGLTGKIYFDKYNHYTSMDIKSLGVKTIPPLIPSPTLDDILFDRVKESFTKYKKMYPSERERLSGDLQDIVRIEKIYVDYKVADVLVFVNDSAGDVEFKVFEGINEKKEYSIVLQKMFNSKTKIFDFDRIDNISKMNIFYNTIGEDIVNLAKKNTAKLGNIDAQITSLKFDIASLESNEHINGGIKPDNLGIDELNDRLYMMQGEMDSVDRIVSMYEFKPLMMDALKTASESVMMIYPYSKISDFSDEVISLLDAALKRSIHVIFLICIDTDDYRSNNYVIKKMQALKKKSYGNHFFVSQEYGDYEKVVIVDDELLVATTFDVIPFKESSTVGFIQESGILSKNSEVIKQGKEYIGRYIK